jgi:ribonuclease P protein component
MRSAKPELSTEENTHAGPPVEDCRRFGLVVPKRHARRAVTRSLIKRQARAVFEAAAARLCPGDWFLRLRSPYPIDEFVSAASAPLRTRVRHELTALFAGAGGARS